jgi:hypothetical protein
MTLSWPCCAKWCVGVEVSLHCHCIAFVVQCTGVIEHIYGLNRLRFSTKALADADTETPPFELGWAGCSALSSSNSESVTEW